MEFVVLGAEDIARQMECANVPTTAGKKFVCANCALLYPINVIRWFSFSKDFRTGAIFMFAPNNVLASQGNVPADVELRGAALLALSR